MSKKTVIANNVEYETILISIPEDYMEDFDFVNLGAKNGSMDDYAQKIFNGQRGLHFEINDDCVKVMTDNCVDFIISTHTIEHLMNLRAVKKMIEISVNAAKDFVYLTWPWFDTDDYLKDLGFIPFPSTWDIHTCHVTISDLKNILRDLSLEGTFLAWPRILDSGSDYILPIDYPRNIGRLHHYKPEYGNKQIVNFTRPVYHESVCFIPLRDSKKTNESFKFIEQYGWDKV